MKVPAKADGFADRLGFASAVSAPARQGAQREVVLPGLDEPDESQRRVAAADALHRRVRALLGENPRVFAGGVDHQQRRQVPGERLLDDVREILRLVGGEDEDVPDGAAGHDGVAEELVAGEQDHGEREALPRGGAVPEGRRLADPQQEGDEPLLVLGGEPVQFLADLAAVALVLAALLGGGRRARDPPPQAFHVAEPEVVGGDGLVRAAAAPPSGSPASGCRRASSRRRCAGLPSGRSACSPGAAARCGPGSSGTRPRRGSARRRARTGPSARSAPRRSSAR